MAKHLRWSGNNLVEGLTFESDGIPEFCMELNDLNVRVNLVLDDGEIIPEFDGQDILYKVCAEEDPVCISQPNTKLQVDKHSHVITIKVFDKEDKLLTTFEKTKCNEDCLAEFDDSEYSFHWLYSLVGAVGSHGDDGLEEFIEVFREFCKLDKGRLEIDFKYRCYQKKSECEGSIYPLSLGCDDEIIVIQIGGVPTQDINTDGLLYTNGDVTTKLNQIFKESTSEIPTTPKELGSFLVTGVLDNIENLLGLDNKPFDSTTLCNFFNKIDCVARNWTQANIDRCTDQEFSNVPLTELSQRYDLFDSRTYTKKLYSNLVRKAAIRFAACLCGVSPNSMEDLFPR